MSQFTIRYARECDVPQILVFIRELARYEDMLGDVVATEDLLREWIFEKKKAEVILAEENDEPVCYSPKGHKVNRGVTRRYGAINQREA